MMAGHCSLNLRQEGNDVFANSSIFTDGGEFIKGFEKHLDNKSINDLIILLEQNDFAFEEDTNSALCWSIGIYDGDNLIRGVDAGFYDKSNLVKILKDIDKSLGNNKVTSLIKEMVNF